MKFMMLMIPAVYHGNKKLDPNFTPDPKMVEKMTKYNEELGKVFKITDLNGLHPLTTGARVSFTKGKTTVTDGPFIEAKEVLGGYWMLELLRKKRWSNGRKSVPHRKAILLKSGKFSTSRRNRRRRLTHALQRTRRERRG